MTPGRRLHLGEQVIDECRHFVLVVCWPPAVVDPGIGQWGVLRWPDEHPTGTDALQRIPLAPAFDVDQLTGFGPIGRDLGD